MYPSSTLCRTQEAHHRALASGTMLANVRRVAERAALAWANEAVVAERREARAVREDAIVVRLDEHRSVREDNDLADGDLASENPDRGLAN